MLKKNDRDEAVNALIDATYINGAPDNVTVVLADISIDANQESFVIGAAQ